jgi:SulP family sulfate permease
MAMLGQQSLINVSNVQEQDFQELLPLLYCFFMFGAGLIEVLPMAALTGLMIGCH